MSKTNFYNKKYTKSKKPDISYIPWYELEILIKTLLQFCIEHGYPEDSLEIESIKNCIVELENENFGKVINFYNMIHFGKEGFNEWTPNIKYPHESDTYVISIFTSLCARWSNIMNHVNI